MWAGRDLTKLTGEKNRNRIPFLGLLIFQTVTSISLKSFLFYPFGKIGICFCIYLFEFVYFLVKFKQPYPIPMFINIMGR